MKLHNYLTICVLISTNTLIYSQKLGKLDEISDQDFASSNAQSSSILYYKSMVTFPYKQDNAKAGAKDDYFTIRIESLVRIKLYKNDPIQKFLGLSKTFGTGIKINSVKYYYKNGKSIATKKIKESDLIISPDDNGYYIDYSKISQDSSAIIDISFRADSKSKQNLLFYLDKNKTYNNFSLQIYIPEIYFYDIITTEQCIKTEIKRDLPGPMIGYNPGTGPNKELLSQVLVDVFKKEFKSNYEQVYCKNNLFTFTKTGPCPVTNDSSKELINLKLKNVIEIK